MGQYIVNGELVDLNTSNPTAADLKNASGSPSGDWVMASKKGGEMVQVQDADLLPVDAEDYSIITPFTYGTAR